jgi:hypothetical protein
MPSQLQGDGGGVGALPLNWVECDFFHLIDHMVHKQPIVTSGIIVNGIGVGGEPLTHQICTGREQHTSDFFRLRIGFPIVIEQFWSLRNVEGH